MKKTSKNFKKRLALPLNEWYNITIKRARKPTEKGSNTMNAMIKKYTTKHRTFEFSYDKRFITVFYDGRMNGFIWNNDKVIMVDGDEVVSSEFFK